MSLKRKTKGKLLDLAQSMLNKLYERKGLTDNLLEWQVKINSIRAESDIADCKKVDDEDGFIQ